jgi:hypothetical protein
MSRIRHFNQGGPVQTTNATTTTVITWDPAAHLPAINNCIVSVTGKVVGKSSVNAGVSIEAQATFSIIAGTVTLLGSQTSTLAAQGSAALTASTITIDASANIIRIRVTGIAATTINWTGYYDIKSSEF